MTNEEFERALTALSLRDLQVAVRSDGRRLIGVVVSPAFEGMDEAERQRLVWHHLHQSFDDHALTRVEFVFTNTPQEDAEVGDAIGAP